MVALSFFVSIFIAIQDPILQKFAVRVGSGYLSENLGAEFKIGRLYISPTLNVVVEDVMAKDLNDNVLLSSDKISAKLFFTDALDGNLHLGKVELLNTEANLVTYKGEDAMNFQFIIDFFASDTVQKPKTGPTPIRIDRLLIKDLDFMLWNQNICDSLKTMQHAMDYAHLDVDDINLNMSDIVILGDSISAAINSLTAKEMSGFELNSFKTDAVVCSKGVFLDGLQIATNNSQLNLDLHMLYNDFEDIKQFVDSVRFDARIYPTDILLSDIGVFAPVMYEMPDRILFECLFTGPIEHFSVDDLVCDFGSVTHFEGNLKMHPLDFNNGEHALNISKMCFSYDDLVHFYIPGHSATIPLPETLKPLRQGSVKFDFKGSYNNFKSNVALTSDIGNVNASIGREHNEKGDNIFAGFVNAERVDVGKFANAEKTVGALDLAADVAMTFPKQGNPDLLVNGDLYRMELLGNFIDQIKIDGRLREKRFNGKLSVIDDDLDLDFVGLVDFMNAKKPKSDFDAVISKADLVGLNILKGDSIAEISTHLKVDMTGFDIDALEGVLNVDNTVFRDSRGEYAMENFRASIVNDNLMMRRINMNCDFFNFEMAGQMNFQTLVTSLKEYFNYYVTVPLWEKELADYEKYKQKHNVDQDFYVNMNLKDSRTLTRLLMPKLSIAKNTTFNGTFTSRSHLLNFTMRSKEVSFGSIQFDNLEVKKNLMLGGSMSTISIDEIVWRDSTETDTTVLGLDKFVYYVGLRNDTIFNSLSWNDFSSEDHNKGRIEGVCLPNEVGASFWVKTADVTINDSVWSLNPENRIEVVNGHTYLSNVEFGHNQQLVKVDGAIPLSSSDTISVNFNKFDISNFDLLFRSMGFDADGFISGNAQLGSLKEKPSILADLYIHDLGMNGDSFGDATLQSVWDNEDESIDVDVDLVDNGMHTLNLYGSYYPNAKKDNLDFHVQMDSLRLGIISPFVSGVMSRVQGFGNGEITVLGSLDQPELNGNLKIKDGGCKIKYLNSFFTFSPTIELTNSQIALKDMVLTDTLGNHALVEGKIYHHNLKDFEFDITLHPRDFMAMATTSRDNESFYGTAVANGLVKIKGPLNDIMLDIKALTRKGTHITIPFNRSTSVGNTDFIHFISPNETDEETEEIVNEYVKSYSSFTMALDVDVTNDAALKIILPNNLGVIDASGNGNVKLGTSTYSNLTLIGDYVINSGRFSLNFKNFLNKMFDLKSGGVISWTGDPVKGKINATGAYTVKASLATLGVQIDTTSNSANNVNAECLIHLKDNLLNPTITFGLNLPGASEDVKQSVYSLLDTTNQAVMSQQVLSLLVLGTFSYAGTSANHISSTSYIDAFTSQMLSGWLSEISREIDLDVHYHAGTAYSNEELQVALKTALFDNRLIIETSLGMITNVMSDSERASEIVGEVDAYYKLSKDGRLTAHFYNHSNNNTNYSSLSFDKRSPYTQGLGFTYNVSFTRFSDLFKKKGNTVQGEPLLKRNNNEKQ